MNSSSIDDDNPKGGGSAEEDSLITGLLSLIRAMWTADQGAGYKMGHEGSGMTLAQFKALIALQTGRSNPCPLKELGSSLNMSPPAVSRLVDGLVEQGLVTRSEDSADRRIRHVALTATGSEYAERALSHRRDSAAAMIAQLNAGQRRALAAAFAALRKNENYATAYEATERIFNP